MDIQFEVGLSQSQLQHVSDCARVLVDHGAKVSQVSQRIVNDAWASLKLSEKFLNDGNEPCRLQLPEPSEGIEKRVYRAPKTMVNDPRLGPVVGVDYEITGRWRLGGS